MESISKFITIPLLFGWAVLAGCQPADSSSPSNGNEAKTFEGEHPIQAVCTTGQVADLVRNVGGDHVEVVQLMGEGVDPHTYEPSPGDVSQLNGADVIFYHGLHLEGKMTEIFERMKARKPTFAVTHDLEEADDSRLLEAEEGVYDPHLWFDVSLWAECLTAVERALVDFDPQHAADYRENATGYRAELDELHAFCQSELAAVPKEQRVMVTAHDAFQYFGQAYDIEVKAIQGISTESEASVKKVNELVDFLVSRSVKAVFVESSVSERNVQSLIEGCAAQDHEVRVGGELFSDAMGEPGTEEGTFPGMIRSNIKTIADALK